MAEKKEREKSKKRVIGGEGVERTRGGTRNRNWACLPGV